MCGSFSFFLLRIIRFITADRYCRMRVKLLASHVTSYNQNVLILAEGFARKSERQRRIDPSCPCVTVRHYMHSLISFGDILKT